MISEPSKRILRPPEHESCQRRQFSDFLDGKRLYGDDFSSSEIDDWFDEEREAYYELSHRDRASYVYEYHALNWLHGFGFLPQRSFRHALGLGSAYGDEFLPISDRVERISIVEPSDGFAASPVLRVPVQYVKPIPDGTLPFPQDRFDLVCCFGVLHHIPNVTAVVREIARCMAPGGYFLLREPVISMGDWRKARPGLTQKERGIPCSVFQEIFRSTGLEVLRMRKCMFPLTSRLGFLTRSAVFNSKALSRIDALLSRSVFWRTRYHATSVFHKIRPRAAFFVLRKRVVISAGAK